MVVCPRCGLKHPIAKEFCEKCGAFLLMDEEDVPVRGGEEEISWMCPRCQAYRPKGNYCKKCGSLLMQGTPSQASHIISLEKRWVRKRSKEWQKLAKEKNTLEMCLRNLKNQEKISSDVCHLMVSQYQERLKELSSLHQEILDELNAVQRRVSEEIQMLENELKPIQKRLEEFQVLLKEGGMTRSDFLREQSDLKKKIRWRIKRLKRCRQILMILPLPVPGISAPKGLHAILVQPTVWMIAAGFFILVLLGGFFLHQSVVQPKQVAFEESSLSSPTPSSLKRSQPTLKDKEIENIRSLFEKVRQANLQQNIDLFMTCFSHDFVDREKKKNEALKTWSHFTYLTLSFDIKKQKISGDTADIQLEWFVRSSEKKGGKLEENRIPLNAVLRKENGSWKIVEIRPLS